MWMRSARLSILALAGTLTATGASAQSAPNCPTMRKVNVGVSVAPPNVVHTSPYVAKALGQSTDLDPGLAAQFLAASMIPDEFRGADGVMPFGPKLEAPESATVADKLAAYLGRQV